MSTKILIGAAELQGLIARQPEIELELVNSAVAQIAGRLAAKVSDNLPNMTKRVQSEIDRLLGTMSERFSDRYRMPDHVKELIRSFLAAECKKEIDVLLWAEAKKQIDAMVRQAIEKHANTSREIMEKQVNDAHALVDAYARDAAEREVISLMRGYSKSEAST